MTEPAPRKSDLGVRVVSAVVMVAVAGTALWLGGWVWMAFVAMVALGVLWEWLGLSNAITISAVGRLTWLIAGLVYIGIAGGVLAFLGVTEDPHPIGILFVLSGVIATDVGAYFAGRTFGGPKIAPKISPSKTWSGYVGGTLAAMAVMPIVAGHCVVNRVNPAGPVQESPFFEAIYRPPVCWSVDHWTTVTMALACGLLLPALAQAGDFFESWMKRRAGVKDSGSIIPGHGGLFDRVDGLLAVCFVPGVIWLVNLLAYR